MKTRTYTAIITITSDYGDLDAQALADRLAAHLEIGCKDWAPFASASVDVVSGDHLRDDQSCWSAKELHRELRAD